MFVQISKPTYNVFKKIIISTTWFFFQGPNPKVLEENMANLNQQLPDADPGVGLQYGVSCTLQGMQNTLKEAARKISILSQEKQQLIEMGNGLRAELAMLLKEGKLFYRRALAYMFRIKSGRETAVVIVARLSCDRRC